MNVEPPPLPEPAPATAAAERAPEVPEERAPRVVVRPPVRPALEGKRDAFVRRIDAKYHRFIEATCIAEGGVGEASANDLCQHVLEVAGEQFVKQGFDESGPPEHMREWLTTLARNAACNHRRVWRPQIDQDADADALFSPMPDPEGTAELAERRARLLRHIEALPQKQKEVVLCLELYDMSIEQTSAAVGRPSGTVASELARGRKRLEELVAESDRATAAGERRRG